MKIPEPGLLYFDQVAATFDRLGCDALLSKYQLFAERKSKNMHEMMMKYSGIIVTLPPESQYVTFNITS